MLEALSAISAVYAAVLMALVVRGYIVLARNRDGSLVHLLSLSIVLVYCCGIARAMYWDILPTFSAALATGEWFFGPANPARHVPNFLFNNLWSAAAIIMLILLHRLIPEHQRADYTIWTAPWYPRKGMLGGIIEMLRRRR